MDTRPHLCRRLARFLLGPLLLLALAACGARPAATAMPAAYPAAGPAYPAAATATPYLVHQPLVTVTAAPAPVFSCRARNTYPHDASAWTQGLVFVNGVLYEGTGEYGRSSLRRVNLETGAIEQLYSLSNDLYGEGIAVFGDRIYQITWQNQVGFVYDRATFTRLREFRYPTEGWGITHDGARLIMSDGSATLRFWDPETLAEIGQVEVRDASGPVTRLNELEYVDGLVYANIWQTDRIAMIDPASGQVAGWIDCAGLLTPDERQPPTDVLNGIAYDAAGDRLFVTGKRWPKLFEIELAPAGS